MGWLPGAALLDTVTVPGTLPDAAPAPAGRSGSSPATSSEDGPAGRAAAGPARTSSGRASPAGTVGGAGRTTRCTAPAVRGPVPVRADGPLRARTGAPGEGFAAFVGAISRPMSPDPVGERVSGGVRPSVAPPSPGIRAAGPADRRWTAFPREGAEGTAAEGTDEAAPAEGAAVPSDGDPATGADGPAGPGLPPACRGPPGDTAGANCTTLGLVTGPEAAVGAVLSDGAGADFGVGAGAGADGRRPAGARCTEAAGPLPAEPAAAEAPRRAAPPGLLGMPEVPEVLGVPGAFGVPGPVTVLGRSGALAALGRRPGLLGPLGPAGTLGLPEENESLFPDSPGPEGPALADALR